MNTEAFVILSILMTFVAVIMRALPAVTRPTTPLGVSVPASRLDEPVIRRAIRRYRLMVTIAWLLCIALLAALAVTTRPADVLFSVFFFVIAQVVAYVVARQMIVKAKHEGRWYEGVPVRLAGSATAAPEPGPVPGGWFIASLLLLVCAYAIAIVVYPTLPASLPTHWGADGVPDAHADKSVWVVFGPLFIATVIVGGFFALSFLGRRVPVRALPGASAETNARREHDMRAAMSTLIGRIMFLVALSLSWTTLASRLFRELERATLIGTLVIVLLILVIVVLFIVRWRRLMRGDARLVAAERGTDAAVDAPDDDRFWKAGILYVNADDPSLFVQRRFGIGWTINLGHPAGIIIGIVLVVVVVGLVVFALTHAAMRA